MKVLLALAFLLWACADAHHIPEHNLNGPIFVPGKLHRYEMTINMTSGIPGLTSQLAKHIIKAHVEILSKDGSEHLMKVVKVLVSESLPAVETDEETLAMKPSPQLEADLSRPIRFFVVNGNITRYTLGDKESQESKKIKRSILRHLVMDLKEVPEKKDYPFAYNTTEETLSGNVSTWYVVNVSPYPHFPYDLNVFNVSKTQNYETVRYPAILEHHNFAKRGCPEVCKKNIDPQSNKYGAGCPVAYEPHQTPLDRYSTSHYNFRLEGKQMVLDTSVSEEKHIASMYDQDMVVTVRMEQKLLSIVDETIKDPENQAEYTDLMVELSPDKSENTGKHAAIYSDIFPKINGKDIIPAVERLLKEVVSVSVMYDISTEDSYVVGEKLILIQRGLSLLTYEHLEQIWKNIPDIQGKPSEDDKVLRQIFLDLLPLSGTDEAVKLIIHLIKESKVLAWEAKELLEAIPENLIRLNPKFLIQLLLLTECKLAEKNPVVHSAAFLCAAKVYRKTCGIERRLELSEYESKLYLSPYEQAVRESSGYLQNEEEEEDTYSNFQKSSLRSRKISDRTPEECATGSRGLKKALSRIPKTEILQKKIIRIETLAHTGSAWALQLLMPYVHGTAEDMKEYAPGDIDYVKTVAIYALHHISAHNSHKILRIVTPIYFNMTEVPRVRIAAFSVILRNQPPLSLLEHVALDSWKEPSREVASYVYSAMESFGNATTPCMKLTADRIKLVMSQFKTHDIGIQHAKSIITTFFDEVRNFAIDKRIAYVPSNESIVPSAIYSSLIYNIDSFKDVLMQTAVNIQGITQEDILNMIDEYVVKLGLEKPHEERDQGHIPKSKENDIFEQLRIIPRLPKALRLTIYQKFFYSSSFIYVDRETFKDTIHALKDYVDHVFSLRDGTHRGHFIKVLIPSSYHVIGYSNFVEYPIQFTMKHPLLLSLKAEFEERQLPAVRTILIRPALYYTTHQRNEIVNMADRKTIGVYHEEKYFAAFPVTIQVKNKLEENKFDISFFMPNIPRMIFRHHSEAGTFAGNTKLGELPSSTRKTIRTLPTYFEKKALLGMGKLPHLEIIGYIEDIRAGIDDLPNRCSSLLTCILQNPDELEALAVKYVRNPGWRYRSLNATIARVDKVAIDKLTFTFEYNRTAYFPEQPVSMPRKCMKPVDTKTAKEVKEMLINGLPYISNELKVSMKTSPAFWKYEVDITYNHTADLSVNSFKAFYGISRAERASSKDDCMNHVQVYCNHPDEMNYVNSNYEKQISSFYNEINFDVCREFNEPDIISKGSLNRLPYKELFDKNEFPESRKTEWFWPETHEKCLKDSKEGKPLTVACTRAIKEQAYFNRYHLNTVWKETVPDLFKNFTLKAQRALRTFYYTSAEINRVNIANPMRTLDITADYVNKLTDTPVVTLRVKTPIENVNYHKIALRYVKPLSSILSIPENYIKEYTNNTYLPTCELMEKWVKTYDLKTFRLPRDNCTYVLSTQCTENKTFAVLARQISSNQRQKEVTIFIGDESIILRPKVSKPEYTIEYNGKVIEVSEVHPRVLNRTARIYAHVLPITQGQSIRSIMPLPSKSILVITAEVAGLRLKYDETNVKLEVSPMYKGELCGLCSTFDGEITKEFLGVDQRWYLDSEDFAHSSIIDSKVCGVDTKPIHPVIPPCEDCGTIRPPTPKPDEDDWKPPTFPDDEEEDSYRRDNLLPEQHRTMHMQREDKVCFSTKPLLVCEGDSVPVEHEWKSVDFHCLPKFDATTRKLVVESKRRILYELSSKSVDFSETLSVPKECL